MENATLGTSQTYTNDPINNTEAYGIITPLSIYQKTGTANMNTWSDSTRLQVNELNDSIEMIYEVQSLDLSAPIETNEKEIVTNLPNSDDFFKQETLEEAVQKVANSDDFINGALFGSLCQQERMYSEEEVIRILIKAYEDVGKRKIPNQVVLANWFEQFKK